MPAGHEITFDHHLELLQSSYIWNIYKHLTQDFLIKTAEIPFHQVQANMRDKVLYPLKNEILKIQVSHEFAHLKDSHHNVRSEELLDFQLIFRKEQSGRETNSQPRDRATKEGN